MAGLQCHKLLWWTAHEPAAAELDVDDARQAVYDQGHRVGALARTYVPGGVLVDLPHNAYEQRLKETRRALVQGAPAVYEAAFRADGVFVSVDILERVEGGFRLVEVKSTTSVKAQHLPDVAVQTHVLRRSGVDVVRVEVMHLNRACAYPDLSNLFTRADVTELVEARLAAVPGEVAAMTAMLAGPLPQVATGPHCSSPYECPFTERCWPVLPPHHVSTLYAMRRRPLPWMIATGVLLVALVASFLMKSPPEPVERQTMRLSAPLPRDLQVSPEVPDITISPDGRTLLCVAVDTLGTRRIYVRPLAGGTFSALAGTEESSIPFWSPDSRYIAFFSGGNLKRMATDGTGMQVLCPAPAQRGGAWSPSNVIVFQPAASGPLMQIAASGGAVTMATTLDSIRGETAHRFPQFLPDGKHYLYVALPGSDAGVETRVGTLGDVTPGPVVALSLNMATFAEPGYLLFNQNESVVAQPFDPLSFKTTGASRVLADLYNVSASYSGSPVVNASRNGILIQREPRGEGMKVVLMDRRGRVTRELPLPAGHFGAPQFSPDGSRIALVYGRPDDAAERVWLVDVARGIMTRFAFDGQWDQDPRWSRDGKRIVWGSDRAAGRELAWKAADGSGAEEILADVPNLFNDPSSVTSEYVVYRSLSGETNEDIWLLPLTGEPTPRPLIQTRFNELDGFVSPDERWVAYRSDESGKHELYVTSFPVPGSKVRVSSNGAAPVTNARPVTISWREDGRELYYIGGDGRTLMSVPVEPGETFRAGTPQRLFRLPRETVDAGMSADGQTLAVVMAVNADARSILNLVINWAQELEGAR
jgi:Tol biopolymer transport system component